MFFAVVFADEHGATVLAKRIREQFVHLQQQHQQTRLTFSVSYKFLSSTHSDVAAPLEETVSKIAVGIEELIKSGIQSRFVHHE